MVEMINKKGSPIAIIAKEDPKKSRLIDYGVLIKTEVASFYSLRGRLSSDSGYL